LKDDGQLSKEPEEVLDCILRMYLMSRVSMYDEVVAAIFACQCLILMILYDKEAEGCLRMLCQRRETFNPCERLACWML